MLLFLNVMKIAAGKKMALTLSVKISKQPKMSGFFFSITGTFRNYFHDLALSCAISLSRVRRRLTSQNPVITLRCLSPLMASNFILFSLSRSFPCCYHQHVKCDAVMATLQKSLSEKFVLLLTMIPFDFFDYVGRKEGKSNSFFRREVKDSTCVWPLCLIPHSD